MARGYVARGALPGIVVVTPTGLAHTHSMSLEEQVLLTVYMSACPSNRPRTLQPVGCEDILKVGSAARGKVGLLALQALEGVFFHATKAGKCEPSCLPASYTVVRRACLCRT